jgi:hypothetical protein
MRLMDIDGDEFAECDYGLVVDNGNGVQDLNQKLDMLAQAALQNQTISFSTVMKLYNSSSLAEKQRMVERDERNIQERQAQAQQQELEVQQQQEQMRMQLEQAKLELQDQMNQRDNETKLLIANVNAANTANTDDGIQVEEYSQEAKDKLKEQMREFDARLNLDRQRLALDKQKAESDASIKRQQLRKKTMTTK